MQWASADTIIIRPPPKFDLTIGQLKEGLHEELKKKTNDFAKKFALKPSLPSQMIKRSVNALTYQNDHSVMHMDYDQFLLSREFSKENSN